MPHDPEKFLYDMQIDQWRDIIGFRHVLVHGYGVVEMDVIVNIARNQLPNLIVQLGELLKEPDQGAR